MSTMTIKGQVTIPKRVRDELGLTAGAEVSFEKDGDRYFIQKSDEKAKEEYRKRIDSVAGTLDLGMSVDEFMRLLRGDDP